MYDGEEDDDDKEEESDVEEEAEHLVGVSRGRLEHVSYPSPRTQTLVNVVYEALHIYREWWGEYNVIMVCVGV